jgi:hypothetical protein
MMNVFRNRKWPVIILLFSICMGFSSCATILGGKRNTLNIQSGQPDSAMVFLDGIYLGQAPFKIHISKYKLQHRSMIEIKKEGYETFYYEVLRSPHIGYVVADILTGVIPLIVDVADGNIYRPNTRKIEYQLVPAQKAENNPKPETTRK